MLLGVLQGVATADCIDIEDDEGILALLGHQPAADALEGGRSSTLQVDQENGGQRADRKPDPHGRALGDQGRVVVLAEDLRNLLPLLDRDAAVDVELRPFREQVEQQLPIIPMKTRLYRPDAVDFGQKSTTEPSP